MAWMYLYYDEQVQAEIAGMGAEVFFCYLKGERIVFLHTFIKKTQKTPHREIETARERMEEVKQQEKAEVEAKKQNAKRK